MEWIQILQYPINFASLRKYQFIFFYKISISLLFFWNFNAFELVIIIFTNMRLCRYEYYGSSLYMYMNIWKYTITYIIDRRFRYEFRPNIIWYRIYQQIYVSVNSQTLGIIRIWIFHKVGLTDILLFSSNSDYPIDSNTTILVLSLISLQPQSQRTIGYIRQQFANNVFDHLLI